MNKEKIWSTSTWKTNASRQFVEYHVGESLWGVKPFAVFFHLQHKALNQASSLNAVLHLCNYTWGMRGDICTPALWGDDEGQSGSSQTLSNLQLAAVSLRRAHLRPSLTIQTLILKLIGNQFVKQWHLFCVLKCVDFVWACLLLSGEVDKRLIISGWWVFLLTHTHLPSLSRGLSLHVFAQSLGTGNMCLCTNTEQFVLCVCLFPDSFPLHYFTVFSLHTLHRDWEPNESNGSTRHGAETRKLSPTDVLL